MFGFGKNKKKKEEELKKQQEQEQAEMEQQLPLELPEEEKAEIIEETPSPAKVNTRVDKLIMGAIVGVAVGSVVGMAIAPKKAEDKPKTPDKKQANSKQKKGGLFGKLSRFGKKDKKEEVAQLKKIPSEAPTDEKL